MAETNKNGAIKSFFGQFFGYDVTKGEPESARNKETKSPITPVTTDGAIEVETAHASRSFYGTSFDAQYKNDKEQIDSYRTMAEDAFVDDAIREIVNSAIIKDEDGIVSLDLENTEFSPGIKNKVMEEFAGIIKILNFNKTGYDLFRSWYVDGRIAGFKVLESTKDAKADGLISSKTGIKRVDFIDSRFIKYIREIDISPTGEKKVKDEYFIYTDEALGAAGKAYRLEKDSVVYVPSGLVDLDGHTISYLHKAYRTYNQLRGLEDSTVIYRITRAPERRVFYIDVGQLPKTKAEQYIQSIIQKYKNKTVYDTTTGAITEKYNVRSMIEDIWLPRKDGGKGTEVSSLPGAQNLGELNDVEYFKKKLYRALNIPDAYLQDNSTVSFGRSNVEVTRDELKFSKFINELRTKFNDLFLDLLMTQLIVKKIITEDEWEENKNLIGFQYNEESLFSEIKDAELLSLRLDLVDRADSYIGKYFTKSMINRDILKRTEDEIDEIEAEIEQEKADGTIPEFSEDELNNQMQQQIAKDPSMMFSYQSNTADDGAFSTSAPDMPEIPSVEKQKEDK